jgi:hypothetical protein
VDIVTPVAAQSIAFKILLGFVLKLNILRRNYFLKNGEQVCWNDKAPGVTSTNCSAVHTTDNLHCAHDMSRLK